jgi:hypothetical protein
MRTFYSAAADDPVFVPIFSRLFYSAAMVNEPAAARRRRFEKTGFQRIQSSPALQFDRSGGPSRTAGTFDCFSKTHRNQKKSARD